MRPFVVVAAAIAVRAGMAGAQTGTLAGTVLRDSVGHELVGAEVSIPDQKRQTRVNYLGVYRFDELKAGKYVVEARAVGFTPKRDTVEIVAGRAIEHEFILSPQPTVLDSVRVVAAAAPPRPISPALRGFEERRKQGFGHFITEEQLRKSDNQSLANLVLGRIPGLHTVNEGSATYLSSGRSVSSSSAPVFAPPSRGAPRATGGGASKIKVQGCWVTIYMDGVRIYDASMTDRDSTYRPPDAGRMTVTEYAGIEYYAGGATIPPQYNGTTGNCGTLLLWTRER